MKTNQINRETVKELVKEAMLKKIAGFMLAQAVLDIKK